MLLKASDPASRALAVLRGAAVARWARDRRPDRAAQRAEALLAPVLPRTRGPAEADISAVAAPDGTEVFFVRTGSGRGDPGESAGWLADFAPTGSDPAAGTGITGVDHVALTQPFDRFDEAALSTGGAGYAGPARRRWARVRVGAQPASATGR